MQSSMTEPMLNNTGNASATQRLLEGQIGPAAAAKALAKPDAWVQAGKTLFQRATGMHNNKATSIGRASSSLQLTTASCATLSASD